VRGTYKDLLNSVLVGIGRKTGIRRPSEMQVDQIEIRSFQTGDEAQVVDLWKSCGLTVPYNDPRRDIQRKLRVQGDMFLVGVMDGIVIATAMVGYDGHRGWVNYLAVAPEHQRKGIARRLMEEAEIRLVAMGCPKINLQVRTSNTGVIKFYEKIGFKMDDVVSMGKRLIEDI
jgi:ribosomal protein S18 acetylase RimI-like enzyme